jgi:hypothetical protein
VFGLALLSSRGRGRRECHASLEPAVHVTEARTASKLLEVSDGSIAEVEPFESMQPSRRVLPNWVGLPAPRAPTERLHSPLRSHLISCIQITRTQSRSNKNDCRSGGHMQIHPWLGRAVLRLLLHGAWTRRREHILSQLQARRIPVTPHSHPSRSMHRRRMMSTERCSDTKTSAHGSGAGARQHRRQVSHRIIGAHTSGQGAKREHWRGLAACAA